MMDYTRYLCICIKQVDIYVYSILPLIREAQVDSKWWSNISLRLSSRLEVVSILLQQRDVLCIQLNQVPVGGDAVWVDGFGEDDGATGHCDNVRADQYICN